MEPLKVPHLMSAPFTPFDNDGNVNMSAIDQYQKFLVNNAIKYVFLNGTTGEGPSLTIDERKKITEKWMELSRLPGREMTIFVQVGGNSFKESEELIKHAVQVGVAAISTLPPLYFPPSNEDELVDYCQTLAALAPTTPMYYYHIPVKTKVEYDMEEFLKKCSKRIPSFRGLKFTSYDLSKVSRCMRVLDHNGVPFDILYGRDEQVLSAFAIGLKGAVGSTFNFMPKLYGCVKAEFEGGQTDLAQKFQHIAVDVIKILFEYGSRTGGIMAAQKAVMEAVGVKVGPPRFPIKPLSDEEKAELVEKLKGIGFFDWQYC